MFCDMFRLAIARSTAAWFSLTLIVMAFSHLTLAREKIKALQAIQPKAPIVFDSANLFF